MAFAQRDANRFGEGKGKSAEDRHEAVERLKLAAKNEKLLILVGWIGAALGIVGAGDLGMGRSAAILWSMVVHGGHPSRA